ncbi:MAG: metal/formaldehyde-sensitive transcriptional repressor [Steroidobacteraceae bacterium]
MAHLLRNKSKLLARVRRLRGQAEALERALGEDQECTAVLQQIAAVRGAANGLMSDVLEEHLREHLGPQSGSVAQRERDLLEVGQIFRRYLR